MVVVVIIVLVALAFGIGALIKGLLWLLLIALLILVGAAFYGRHLIRKLRR